jgi:hypothetical protein
MRSPFTPVALCAGATIVTFAMSTGLSTAGAPPTVPVNVVNPSVPVTVQQTTSVPVQVGNTAANPAIVRAVDLPTRPFQINRSFTMNSGVGLANGLVYTVPSGKVFVIEYANVSSTLPNDQDINSSRILVESVSGPINSYPLMPIATNNGQNGFTQWSFSDQVRLYAVNSLSFVTGRAGATSSPLGSVTVRVALSGHLVDL